MKISEETFRQSKILNTILIGLFLLSILGFVHRILLFLFKMNIGKGTPFWVSIFFILLFYFLLWLSKAGYPRVSAIISISLLLLATFQVSLQWGVDVPQTIAIYSLLIVMSGILVSPKGAFIFVGIISVVLMTLFYLHTNSFILLSQNWKATPATHFDIGVLLFTYGVIAVISWLSSREIRKSLYRARCSEKNATKLAGKLKKQRDNLEKIVEKRTQQLKEHQLQQLEQVNTFAKYGKIVSGILHDINNPLMVIALNLDSLKDETKSENLQLIQTALKATKNIESVIKSSRKQLVNELQPENFDVVAEIKNTLVLFEHHFFQKKIDLQFERVRPLMIFGIPTKFTQVFSNILLNSIESFAGTTNMNRKITVSVSTQTVRNRTKKARIAIQDTGKGIKDENKNKIFSVLFSTKNKTGGTGLGLHFSQKTIEQYFQGKIFFRSQYLKGSQFIIEIPYV